jgi:hypothetical protein
VERLWWSIKYDEVYLKAYQNESYASKGIGAKAKQNAQKRCPEFEEKSLSSATYVSYRPY